MKKQILIGLVVLACAVTTATAQRLESALPSYGGSQTEPELGSNPFLRYYTPKAGADTRVNPSGEFSCGAWNPPYCEATYRANREGYRGYTEEVPNFTDTNPGDKFYAIWDYEETQGGERTGFYSWAAGFPTSDDTMLWSDDNCVGTIVVSCLGPVNADSAAGTGQVNVPGGGTVPRGGLRPIPVPEPGVYDTATGDIPLTWPAVTAINAASDEARYDLYYATDDASDGSCTRPQDVGSYTFLRTEATNSTTVNVADVGLNLGDESCVTFTIQLRYPAAGGSRDEIVSAFWSRASAATYIGEGGLAAEITDLNARQVAPLQVEVSWKTALEDGVVGFYVTRALMEGGTYERVSGLIPANGEPSAYSFIDSARNAQLGARTRVSGLFYKVEVVDIDDNVTPFGPVEAQLSTQRPQIQRQRLSR